METFVFRRDYLVVGAGLFGATFANSVTRMGKRVLVIDRRNNVGGNCYDTIDNGILVHKYGPHTFHTSNKKVWDWVNQFAEFVPHKFKIVVKCGGRAYSFPINLFTLNQVWGVTTPEEANLKLESVKIRTTGTDFKSYVLSQVGEELFKLFFDGYTKKQWGRDPSQLPQEIAKRVPVRLTWDDSYYNDRHQGLPLGGYTRMVENMLTGIEVNLKTNYFEDKNYFDGLADRVVYSGPIDELFDYRFGRLPYRGLTFKSMLKEVSDYQGVGVVNYTEETVPWTRVVEHKHLTGVGKDLSHTIITEEYPRTPERGEELYYPLNDSVSNLLYHRYRELVDPQKVIIGGRLGSFTYYNMDQVIEQALEIIARLPREK